MGDRYLRESPTIAFFASATIVLGASLGPIAGPRVIAESDGRVGPNSRGEYGTVHMIEMRHSYRRTVVREWLIPEGSQRGCAKVTDIYL